MAKRTFSEEEVIHLQQGIRERIETYQNETNPKLAMRQWRELKSRLVTCQESGLPVGLLINDAVKAQQQKLTEFAQGCPTNDLECRTAEGFCTLSADREERQVCEYQGESFYPQTSDEYCRKCQCDGQLESE